MVQVYIDCEWFLGRSDVFTDHHSQILFLNKTDIFDEKIKISDIRTFFPVSRARVLVGFCLTCLQDFEGSKGDSQEGKEYFKKRFLKLSAKSNRVKEREIYTQ